MELQLIKKNVDKYVLLQHLVEDLYIHVTLVDKYAHFQKYRCSIRILFINYLKGYITVQDAAIFMRLLGHF